jgi:prepilin-type N-terminal cleavage/methylation domain-containing protein/prepilin-type processing-associated H-X9-DG protein
MRVSLAPHRLAFNLVELVVVIAIAGVLSGLVLAAAQSARAQADRIRCANQLHQIGLAMYDHLGRYGVFPSNGGWDGRQQIQDKGGRPFYVLTYDLTVAKAFHWGVGAPRRAPQDQTGSWAYALLPALEQGAVYDRRDWAQPLGMYTCLGRRRPIARPAWDDEFGLYYGGGWTWGKIDYAGNAYVIPNRPRCLRIADLLDGTANTILVGEKALSPLLAETGSWYWDEPFFTGGSGGTQRGFAAVSGDGLAVVRDSPSMGLTFRYNWGAPHPAGAQFLFADGSVHMLRYGMPAEVVKSLLTPNGGEPTPSF